MQPFSHSATRPIVWRAKSQLVFALLTLFAAEVFLAMAAVAATDVPAKRVLIIDSFGRDIGPFNAVAAAFRTTLAREWAQPIDVDEAPFDTARFAEPKQEANFVDFLQNHYGGRKLDLLVPINFPALSFVLRHRNRLFPETPMLITATDQRRIRPEFLTTKTAVVPYNVNIPELVEGILQVLPDTKNIVVVIGNSPLEKFWQGEFRREFPQFANRVSFTWFNDLSFEEMKRRAALLPAHSAIFYFFVTRDAVGVPYSDDMTLKGLSAVANAPIFPVFESQFGQGVVGGWLLPDKSLGVEAARVALRILRGEVPSNIPTKSFKASPPIYDERELRRWGISESRLPPGSIVQFRQPTFWDQYRWYIIAALIIIGVQAGLIVGLLLQRARRRRAEGRLRESQEFMELSTSAGELGLWVRDLEGGELWANPRLRSLFGFGQNDVLRFEDLLGRIDPEDRARVVADVERAQGTGGSFEDEFRVMIPGGSERWVLARGRTVDELNGSGARKRRMGAVLDITERKRAEGRSREVLEAAPNAMIMVSQEGKISLVNAAVELVFGYPRDQLIDCPIEMLIPERFRGQHLDHRLSYFADPEMRAMGTGRELFGRRKDGSEVPVEIGLTPMRTAQGLFVLASIIDITARKQAEQDLQAAFEEIRGLKERLEEENLYLKDEISEVKGFDEIVGESDALKYVLSRVEQVAKTDCHRAVAGGNRRG